MTRDIAGGRRAKIICTLGPSVDDDAQLETLMRQGMDAARINLSFGTPEEHIRRIEQVQRLSAGPNRRPVALIADLPGRKARLGKLADGLIRVVTGDVVRFVRDEGQPGDAGGIPAPQSFFHDNLTRGETVLLSDGVVELAVTSVRDGEVDAEVVYGGIVAQRTGLHSQGMPLDGGPLTDEDLPLLRMAVDHGVDYIALSWVCDDTDILTVKEHLSELGHDLPIIAKIERPEAFARLDGILRRADAVMIRRGDLGAQIEVTRVPLVQKEIMRLANQAGVPVIIATQMLGSMIRAPRPTRAEASDVSNAVADGADGVLLSAETAVGEYPAESVEMMCRIVKETETERVDRPLPRAGESAAGFADTTASIAVEAAGRTHARLIACFTESGRTANLVSKYRPAAPILAFCHADRTRRRLAVTWGVRSDALEVSPNIDEMVAQVEARLLARGLVEPGDRLVLVFGSPAGTAGRTNTVRLHRIQGPRSTPTPARTVAPS
jgi:pyruvate kinase